MSNAGPNGSRCIGEASVDNFYTNPIVCRFFDKIKIVYAEFFQIRGTSLEYIGEDQVIRMHDDELYVATKINAMTRIGSGFAGEFSLFRETERLHKMVGVSRNRLRFVNGLVVCPVCKLVLATKADHLPIYRDEQRDFCLNFLSRTSYNPIHKAALCWACTPDPKLEKREAMRNIYRLRLRRKEQPNDVKLLRFKLGLWGGNEGLDKNRVTRSIIRHIKAVSRIRPLSRSESVFFKMILGVREINKIALCGP